MDWKYIINLPYEIKLIIYDKLSIKDKFLCEKKFYSEYHDTYYKNILNKQSYLCFIIKNDYNFILNTIYITSSNSLKKKTKNLFKKS